jgi:hypothetical protein
MGSSSTTVSAEIQAHLLGSELEQVSGALDALTQAAGSPVYVQNMSTLPDPGSDLACRNRTDDRFTSS